ncbi:SpoIIE family protein phosphatase [Anaerocolumna sedimenticola]|uniref:SpoIIE family protein phosphatase n=1 Tax=Anaerocolumna sedimenticola TaxID=2696063 RepID=A0A6P1TQF2_9FIRM|nr:SpoIIE family protein phosphatase [Anaerocolumna sedimenticola]QHQ62577.1 SpoIIE family protein phosphatase [Anaerocolumna sedimenticola]
MEPKKNVRISLGFKTAMGIVFIAAILSAVAIIFGYQTYKKALEDQLIQTAFNLARTMAAEVHPDSIDRYLKSGKEDDAYLETRKHLINIQESNNIVYAVVTKPTDEGFYYIYDTDQSDEAFALGDFQEFYPGDFLDNKQNFLSGNIIEPIITNYEFGWLISALVPIKDEGGIIRGYVNVDLSMTEIKAMERNFLIRLAGILISLTLLLAVLLLAATRKILVTPINRLASATGDFVRRREREEGVNGILDLPGLDTRDELGHLYRSIRQMESDIYTYIDDLTAITAEKERIGAELDVAKDIQASMLPCIFPAFPERTELDIYATMTPAKEVGGDFYDFFLVDEDHLAMVMADVSGKGVPAALFMVIAKTLLKNVTQTGLSPKDVLEKVNNQLCVNNEAEMFVTVWLGILEISTGKLICANAGHEYPVLKKAKGDYELIKDKHGFVLAGMEDSHYKEYELQIESGDMLFLYTDGVAEATNALNELYGTDRMLDALNRNKDVSCEFLLHRMKEDIDAFVGEAPQFDDITMLSLELMPKNDTGFKKLKLSPSLESIELVSGFVEQELESVGIPMKVIAQMNVAVDEIFSNIVQYSGASEITVWVTVEERRIILRFTDNGYPYDPTKKPDPDTNLSAEERDIGGLGIFIVKKSMDTLEYEYQDGLNILTLTKQW